MVVGRVGGSILADTAADIPSGSSSSKRDRHRIELEGAACSTPASEASLS